MYDDWKTTDTGAMMIGPDPDDEREEEEERLLQRADELVILLEQHYSGEHLADPEAAEDELCDLLARGVMPWAPSDRDLLNDLASRLDGCWTFEVYEDSLCWVTRLAACLPDHVDPEYAEQVRGMGR